MRTLRGLGIEYEDCPIKCSKRKPEIDPYRVDLCDQCSKAKKYEEFKRKMVREWNKWFINEGWRPNFDEIQEQFGYMVSARLLGEEQMSVTQAHYHDLYEREEQRYEKFKEILDAQ